MTHTKAQQLTGCGHIDSKAEPGDVDDEIVGTEVVQDISLGLVGENDVAGNGHEEAANETHACWCVGDSVESSQVSSWDGLSRGLKLTDPMWVVRYFDRWTWYCDDRQTRSVSGRANLWPKRRLTANEITPIAWNTPGFINENTSRELPRNAGSTAAPLKITEDTMTIIETSAKVEDLESLTISRCKLRGNETATVTRKMTIRLSTSRRRTGWEAREGKTYAMTWGMESPVSSKSAFAEMELREDLYYDVESTSPAESEGELKERDGWGAHMAEAVVHDLRVAWADDYA